MKKAVYKYIVLLFAIALVGCEKIIEPKDLPDQDPKLVLNSVLYTTQSVTANISSSKSILSGKAYKLVTDAECDLYEDGSWVERLKHDSLGYYTGTYMPVADRQYMMKVNAPGYPGIDATTKMPPAVTKVRVERYDTNTYTYNNYIMYMGLRQIMGSGKFKIWVTDDPALKNYYSFATIASVFDSVGNKLDLQVSPSFYANTGSTQLSYGTEVSDEVLVNGREVFIDADVNIYSTNNTANAYSIEILLQVSNISEEVYRYKQTVIQQAAMGPNFFAEPVLVYNNVQNGMGLLGSTNSAGTITLFKGKLNR
jgi:hypothetical protein